MGNLAAIEIAPETYVAALVVMLFVCAGLTIAANAIERVSIFDVSRLRFNLKLVKLPFAQHGNKFVIAKSLLNLVRVGLFALAGAHLLTMASELNGIDVRLAGRSTLALIGVLVVFILIERHIETQRIEHELLMTEEEKRQKDKEYMTNQAVMSAREKRKALIKQSIGSWEKANFVVTNPTHYAIGFSWKMDDPSPPRCVAKAAGSAALQAIKECRERRVMILPQPFLAREMFQRLSPGEYLVEKYFVAIAVALRVAGYAEKKAA